MDHYSIEHNLNSALIGNPQAAARLHLPPAAMVKAATVTLRLLKRVGLPDSLEEIGAPLGASGRVGRGKCGWPSRPTCGNYQQ